MFPKTSFAVTESTVSPFTLCCRVLCERRDYKSRVDPLRLGIQLSALQPGELRLLGGW